MEISIRLQDEFQNDKHLHFVKMVSRNIAGRSRKKILLSPNSTRISDNSDIKKNGCLIHSDLSVRSTKTNKVDNSYLNQYKTHCDSEKDKIRNNLFNKEVDAIHSHHTNENISPYDYLPPTLDLKHNTFIKDSGIKIVSNNDLLPKESDIFLMKTMRNKGKHKKGKSVLFNLLHSPQHKRKIVKNNDTNSIKRISHYQQHSMSEKKSNLPMLNKHNDISSFLDVVANLPKNTCVLKHKSKLQLNNELRKLKTDDKLGTPPSFSKYNPKTSAKKPKRRIFKELQNIQENSHKKQKLHNDTDKIYYSVNQDEPENTNKEYNKSNTKVFNTFSNKKHKYTKSKTITIQPENYNTYKITKKQHENIKKEKIKTKLKIMDKQLRNLSKDNDNKLQDITINQVNVNGLNRLLKFLNIVKFNHNDFVPLSIKEEIDSQETITDDDLLLHNYYATKTLNKLGPAKYVKTKFKSTTVRKFVEKNGLLMGN